MGIHNPSWCGKETTCPEATCPSQVRFSYIPALNFGYNFSSQSHVDWIFHLLGFLETGAFSPSQLTANNPQRVPGPFHKPYPWSPHTGQPHVFTRKGESEWYSHSNSNGRGDWGGEAMTVTVAFRHSYKLHPLCSGYSRWWRVQKPHPQKTVKYTSECLAKRNSAQV